MEYRYSRDDLQDAIHTLMKGGVLLYPTDTVWGIGCDATNEKAVKKIFALKQRSDAKSMLILVDSIGRLASYVEQIPDVAWNLVEMTTKPLSIIYDKGKNLAPSVIAEDGSIGIRICEEPFVQNLIKRLKKPIVSTSANISGNPTPEIYKQISDSIKNSVDYCVHYRREDTQKASSSSIIKLGNKGEVFVIRE